MEAMHAPVVCGLCHLPAATQGQACGLADADLHAPVVHEARGVRKRKLLQPVRHPQRRHLRPPQALAAAPKPAGAPPASRQLQNGQACQARSVHGTLDGQPEPHGSAARAPP